jgi:hypothetical protein
MFWICFARVQLDFVLLSSVQLDFVLLASVTTQFILLPIKLLYWLWSFIRWPVKQLAVWCLTCSGFCFARNNWILFLWPGTTQF